MDKMKQLYPLKFNPVPSERPWGGHELVKKFNKPFDAGKVIGESWEVSGFEQASSVVADGFLAECELYDLVETYMDELVGEDNYKRFGNEFPLLIKFLDIQDRLSVQVHPDDETAFDRHGCYGKSECWYVMDAAPDAVVYMGFNRDVEPNEFYQLCKEGRLEEVLNVVHPKKGDFFYIEAGTVHSATGGVTIAEVQQLSDATYRIYDWGRELNPATRRQMHLDEAFTCINYKKYDADKYFVPAERAQGYVTRNEHFSVSILPITDKYHIYPANYGSFIVYLCVEGACTVECAAGKWDMKAGESMLIPASMSDFFISPEGESAKVVEAYIEKPSDEDGYVEEDHCDCGHEHHGHDHCDCGHHHHNG